MVLTLCFVFIIDSCMISMVVGLDTDKGTKSKAADVHLWSQYVSNTIFSCMSHDSLSHQQLAYVHGLTKTFAF